MAKNRGRRFADDANRHPILNQENALPADADGMQTAPDGEEAASGAHSLEEQHPLPGGTDAATFKKRRGMTPFLIIAGVVLAGIIAAVAITVSRGTSSSPQESKETLFIEQATELIKKGEKIQIQDPELGLIEIEAVAGAVKNNYDNDNFALDDDGFLTYYIDGETASCTGVDLSEYQGDVDLEKVKAAGVDYVMLRIGGRYYSKEGGLYDDDSFLTYYENAKKAGLKVGAYFFSQAASTDDATEEANFVIEKLDGLALDYPVAFDWETIADDSARTDVVTGEMLTDIAEAFCDTLSEQGYDGIIYSNTALMYYMYDLERMKEYEFWVADYAPYPTMYYGFTMWQYTTEGIVDGIDGTVDLNVCFKNY